MKKIFIVLVFILLVSAGCGAVPESKVSAVTSSPAVSASVTPEPPASATVTIERSPSASKTPEPKAGDDVILNTTLPKYTLNSDSIILKSGLKISDAVKYFGSKKGELVKKLGDGYKVVDAGAEGSDQGFYYSDSGLTLVFSGNDNSDKAPLLWIEFDADKLDLGGLTADMSFKQIQAKLGKGTVTKENIEKTIWQHDYRYVLSYKIGKASLEFWSYAEDGSDGWSAWIEKK